MNEKYRELANSIANILTKYDELGEIKDIMCDNYSTRKFEALTCIVKFEKGILSLDIFSSPQELKYSIFLRPIFFIPERIKYARDVEREELEIHRI